MRNEVEGSRQDDEENEDGGTATEKRVYKQRSKAKSTREDVRRNMREVTHREKRGARGGRKKVGARFVARRNRAERRAKLRDHVSSSAPEVSARR